MDNTQVSTTAKQPIRICHNTLMHAMQIILFSASLLALTGCGILIKGAAETAWGGTTNLLIIEPVQDLSSYDYLAIQPFTSSVGGSLDDKYLTHLNWRVSRYNSRMELQQKQGKQLQLNGKILHFTDGYYEKQILLQLRLNDGATGESLGLVNVMGEANTFRGLSEVVTTLADRVKELLVENHFTGLN